MHAPAHPYPSDVITNQPNSPLARPPRAIRRAHLRIPLLSHALQLHETATTPLDSTPSLLTRGTTSIMAPPISESSRKLPGSPPVRWYEALLAYLARAAPRTQAPPPRRGTAGQQRCRSSMDMEHHHTAPNRRGAFRAASPRVPRVASRRFKPRRLTYEQQQQCMGRARLPWLGRPAGRSGPVPGCLKRQRGKGEARGRQATRRFKAGAKAVTGTGEWVEALPLC